MSGGRTISLLLLLMIALAKFLSFRGGFSQSVRMAQDAIRSVGWSQNPLLPSSWVSQGILQLGNGNTGSAVFYMGLFVANSLFLCVVAHWMSSRLLPPRPPSARGRSCFSGRP